MAETQSTISQGQFDSNHHDLKGQLPGGNKTKKQDIVKQIKDLYMRKKPAEKEKNVLIPTKATLFGLDVRFRVVDQKMLEEKMRRTAFKTVKTREQGGPANRHEPPLEKRLVHSQASKRPTLRELTRIAQVRQEYEDGLDLVKFEKLINDAFELQNQHSSLSQASQKKGQQADGTAVDKQESNLMASFRQAMGKTIKLDGIEPNSPTSLAQSLTKTGAASSPRRRPGSPSKNGPSVFHSMNEYDDSQGGLQVMSVIRPTKIGIQGSKFESQIGQQFFQGLFEDQKEKKKQQFAPQRRSIARTMNRGRQAASAEHFRYSGNAKVYNNYVPPEDKYQIYRVNTGNCYDSVMEANLNTGLPPGCSYITDKQLEGKKEPTQEQIKEQERKAQNKENYRIVEYDSSKTGQKIQIVHTAKFEKKIQQRAELLMNKYAGLKLNAQRIQEEYARYGIIQSQDEIELMFRRAVATMNKLAKVQKDEANEEKLLERQKMFNTAKDDDEAKKPGHIQNARLWDTEETKKNIRDLEEKSRPGLMQMNKEEEERAMKKRTEKKTKSKTSYMSRQSKDSGAMNLSNLEELKWKDRERERSMQVKPWVRIEDLNAKAKDDCSFLQENLLEDLKGKQSQTQRKRQGQLADFMTKLSAQAGSQYEAVMVDQLQEVKKSLLRDSEPTLNEISGKKQKDKQEKYAKKKFPSLMSDMTLNSKDDSTLGSRPGTQQQPSTRPLGKVQSVVQPLHKTGEVNPAARPMQKVYSATDGNSYVGKYTQGLGDARSAQISERPSEQVSDDEEGGFQAAYQQKCEEVYNETQYATRSAFQGAYQESKVRQVKEPGWQLNFNERSLGVELNKHDANAKTKKIDFLSNQLSVLERQDFNAKIREETAKYEELARSRYDSEKNWSIMIQNDQNDIRNQAMRKFTYEDIKKRNLPDFKRRARLTIIKTRKQQEEQALSSQDGISTAAETNNKLFDITKDQLQGKVEDEFLDYMKGIATKDGSQPVPTNNISKSSEANRKKLLQQIKLGEQDEDWEPEVPDIAKHIEKELDLGDREIKRQRKMKDNPVMRESTIQIVEVKTTQADLEEIRLGSLLKKTATSKLERQQGIGKRYAAAVEEVLTEHKIAKEKRKAMARSSKQKTSTLATTESIRHEDEMSTSIWADPQMKLTAGIILYDFIYEHITSTRKDELADFIKKRTDYDNNTVIKAYDRDEAARLTKSMKSCRDDASLILQKIMNIPQKEFKGKEQIPVTFEGFQKLLKEQAAQII